ncbi:MAG: SufE family protein [Bacteroidota bacterium]
MEDWMDKYTHLIEMAKELDPLPEEYKDEDHIVRGCQSKVWLHAQQDEDKVKFLADSDAIITKGIIALLIRIFSHQQPKDIIEANTDFIDEIGLKEHLSPTRANGLVSMVKQLKMYAMAYQTQI